MTTNWKRDVFLIPLLIALTVAVVTFGLPWVFESKPQLSYTIEGPNSYFPQKETPLPKGTDISVVIGGTKVKELNFYKAKIWNSGSKPLNDIPVLYSFEPESKATNILAYDYVTEPKKEFGKIEDKSDSYNSKRLIYSLLNPGDEVIATFLTSTDAELKIYSKIEGLVLKEVEAKDQSPSIVKLNIALVLSSFLASTISMLITGSKKYQSLFKRKKKSNKSVVTTPEAAPPAS